MCSYIYLDIKQIDFWINIATIGKPKKKKLKKVSQTKIKEHGE